MEATAVSVGKAVLDGVVGYAKSAAAEEVALQLGVDHDVGFIADELEMMQSFLMTADEERDQNKVLNTWVKQVRNVAYNVEDSLVDFEVHAEREKPPLMGCIPRNPCDRRRIAIEVKELKAKVEEVSSRNLRYRLIKDAATGSKPGSTGVEHGNIGDASGLFDINGAWRSAMEQDKPKVDLGRLVLSDVVDLQVVAVWGTSGDLGKTFEICKVFDVPDVKSKFGCRAWVRLMHQFDSNEFLQSLVRQFCMNFSQDKEVSLAQEGKTVGTNVLLKMEKMGKRELVHEYDAQVSSNRYLIVVDGISKIDEWHCIKSYFPDKKNGSRIVVTTQQVDIASLCPEQPYQVSELRHLSSDQVLYLFHNKVEKAEMGYGMPISKSAPVTTTDPSSSAVTSSEIQGEGVRQPNVADGGNIVYTTSTVARKIYRSKTVIPDGCWAINRETEVGRPTDSHHAKVISVWGMGGIGKTTLLRSVYRSQQLSGWKRAWATVLRPFNRDTLLRNLALQLIEEGPTGAGEKKNIATMRSLELASELSILFGKQNCLIVLDDLSSIDEWNSMKDILAKSRRIIATAREKFVAKHCSDDDQNIYSLKGLEDDVALDLFKNKVFKDASSFDLHPSMLELAKLILKKCDGLPLAISTIGSYLANKPKNALEWRKLNDSLTAELEINPELKMINTALMRSYDGLPYHLKACFLYLSVFPEDHIIRRSHVVKRWIAEGFSREIQHMTAVQVGNKYFDELLDRSMTLTLEGEYGDSCQLHDLIREICVAKAREDNLVVILEEGCSLGGTQGAIRHLVISSNWKRDRDVIQRMLDLSHIRSLTVFGEWRSFFISNKMRFLRVLDLEHTVGLRDHHLYQIMALLHLRYLSLRGCVNILKLPDSLANLRQLQTLDVRNTYIWKLPVTVTSLQKLQKLE
ncbi:hypothetical protein EJB05_28742 [Eragrostis curvula]|uniref:NB-ARC domain-containing protein n=1 Tax=Eragrostis curvula TaxID=38414 RepID=A0A5J9URQ7_9POAL|nr:hypothetical protein EJB05_28742 [Eragrostis curvula]